MPSVKLYPGTAEERGQILERKEFDVIYQSYGTTFLCQEMLEITWRDAALVRRWMENWHFTGRAGVEMERSVVGPCSNHDMVKRVTNRAGCSMHTN